MKDEPGTAAAEPEAECAQAAAKSPPGAGAADECAAAAEPSAAGDPRSLSEEIALIAALRDHDPKKESQAYERLVRTYGAQLLTVARQLLISEADAQDVLQETFLSIFLHIGTFAGDSRLLTWMHRIVVNAALMRLRTQRRKAEQPIDELLPSYREDGHQVSDTLPWRASVASELEDEQTRALVRQAIDKLPETYRTVLVLRDIQELDTLETAQLLGLTQGAVKVRLHRARQALRKLLEPHFIDLAAGRSGLTPVSS